MITEGRGLRGTEGGGVGWGGEGRGESRRFTSRWVTHIYKRKGCVASECCVKDRYSFSVLRKAKRMGKQREQRKDIDAWKGVGRKLIRKNYTARRK